jgi:hypothetical protein
METYLQKEKIFIQYVPPHNHRANKAERAIRDVKNHIISCLSTTHASFPLDLWDDILPHVHLTLNLLRPFAPDPTISAYQGIYHVPYDFLAHPISPFGTSVLIYDSPTTRQSWASHGTPGYYLGPALKHYRSYHVVTTASRTYRITDTLAWYPAPLKLPGSSPLELLLSSVDHLTTSLHEVSKSNLITVAQRLPFQSVTATLLESLEQAIKMLIPKKIQQKKRLKTKQLM